MPFTDVTYKDWFFDYVEYAYDCGLMQGTSSTTFEPNRNLTRAMFVTILGRLEGINIYRYFGTDFTDVSRGEWYTPYIKWASTMGITVGNGDGTFGPDNAVNREEMAIMIARYVQNFGYSLQEVPNPIGTFSDIHRVSDWALDGLDLMRRTGLIVGDENGNFCPRDTATRAEAATIFVRLHTLLNGGIVNYPDTGNWKQAYVEVILNEVQYFDTDYIEFQLLYVDDDNIPELWINTGTAYGGNLVVSYHNGQAVTNRLADGYMQYLEGKGQAVYTSGRQGYYSDIVYRMVDGELVQQHYGQYVQTSFGSGFYNYTWDGASVTKNQYQSKLDASFDFDNSISTINMINQVYNLDGILLYLQ